MGLESSETCCCMFADNCAFAFAGICAGSNATLCAPPETMMNFTPSPVLIVTSAGSKRKLPCASCSIFTSTLWPVIGEAASGGEACDSPADATGVGVVAVAAESVVSFFSPPQAAAVAAITKIASLWSLIYSRTSVDVAGVGLRRAREFVEGIVRDTHVRVQVGEVSTITDIEHLIRAGVDQVIVGSRAIEEPEWLADVAELYPGAITVATDVRDRRVVRRGWVRTLPVDILDLVDELNQLSLGGLLVTMPQRDGPMPQSELALLEDAAEHAQYSVSVVGGGSSIQDLRALEHRGITGVVIDARKIFGGDIDARVIAQEFGA